MLQLSTQGHLTMDRDVRARDLIQRAELFRNRKLRQVRRRLDFGGGEGSMSGDSSPHSLVATMDPSMEELTSKQAQDLKDKYNFDFVEEERKEGPFEWEKIVESPKESQDVPEFYFRAPHKKKHEVCRISPKVLESRRCSPPSDQQRSPLLLAKASSSPNGSSNKPSSFRLPMTTTPVTRQLFYDGEETGSQPITSTAGITSAPHISTSSSCHGGALSGNGYCSTTTTTSFTTGIHHDPKTFTASIVSIAVGGDGNNAQNRESAIVHRPLALNGNKRVSSSNGNVATEASTARSNTQGNIINTSSNDHRDISSSSRQISGGEDELVSSSVGIHSQVVVSPSMPTGEKTPPHPGISISDQGSAAEGEVITEVREETPSTSVGIGERKRTATGHMTDYFPEKKRNLERVKRKVFDE